MASSGLRIFGLIYSYLALIVQALAILAICYGLYSVSTLPDEQNQENKIPAVVWIIPLAIYLVIALLYMVLTACLLHGIRKKRHNLMLPWLIISCLGMLFSGLNIIWNIVLVFKNEATIASLFVLLIVTGISLLILYFMYKLYIEIKTENTVNQFGKFPAPQQVISNYSNV